MVLTEKRADGTDAICCLSARCGLYREGILPRVVPNRNVFMFISYLFFSIKSPVYVPGEGSTWPVDYAGNREQSSYAMGARSAMLNTGDAGNFVRSKCLERCTSILGRRRVPRAETCPAGAQSTFGDSRLWEVRCAAAIPAAIRCAAFHICSGSWLSRRSMKVFPRHCVQGHWMSSVGNRISTVAFGLQTNRERISRSN